MSLAHLVTAARTLDTIYRILSTAVLIYALSRRIRPDGRKPVRTR